MMFKLEITLIVHKVKYNHLTKTHDKWGHNEGNNFKILNRKERSKCLVIFYIFKTIV